MPLTDICQWCSKAWHLCIFQFCFIAISLRISWQSIWRFQICSALLMKSEPIEVGNQLLCSFKRWCNIIRIPKFAICITLVIITSNGDGPTASQQISLIFSLSIHYFLLYIIGLGDVIQFMRWLIEANWRICSPTNDNITVTDHRLWPNRPCIRNCAIWELILMKFESKYEILHW